MKKYFISLLTTVVFFILLAFSFHYSSSSDIRSFFLFLFGLGDDPRALIILLPVDIVIFCLYLFVGSSIFYFIFFKVTKKYIKYLLLLFLFLVLPILIFIFSKPLYLNTENTVDSFRGGLSSLVQRCDDKILVFKSNFNTDECYYNLARVYGVFVSKAKEICNMINNQDLKNRCNFVDINRDTFSDYSACNVLTDQENKSNCIKDKAKIKFDCSRLVNDSDKKSCYLESLKSIERNLDLNEGHNSIYVCNDGLWGNEIKNECNLYLQDPPSLKKICSMFEDKIYQSDCLNAFNQINVKK